MTTTIYQMILDNLHITYTPDDSTRRRLENEINDGITAIKKYCAPVPDCEPGGAQAELLREYVLRAESGAADTWYRDFAGEILSQQAASEVAAYAEAMGYGA